MLILVQQILNHLPSPAIAQASSEFWLSCSSLLHCSGSRYKPPKSSLKPTSMLNCSKHFSEMMRLIPHISEAKIQLFLWMEEGLDFEAQHLIHDELSLTHNPYRTFSLQLFILSIFVGTL